MAVAKKPNPFAKKAADEKGAGKGNPFAKKTGKAPAKKGKK